MENLGELRMRKSSLSLFATDRLNQKFVKGKPVRSVKKEKVLQTKRICFPWLKNLYTIKIKAYMAWLIDQATVELTYIRSDDLKIKKFHSYIAPKVNEMYPDGYRLVKAYYNKRGKKLSKSHYSNLLYARLCNMYDRGFSVRTSEHPSKTTNWKLRDVYSKLCTGDYL